MEPPSHRRRKSHAFLNCSCILLLLILLYKTNGIFRNPNLSPQRRTLIENSSASCAGLTNHNDYASQCEFLRSNRHCKSRGFIDYIRFFYCDCENFHVLGFGVLAVWLMALFYMLGNTAADYFCCNLEKLSKLLRLPPTVAGVTLLPFGNGAPDVFASIAAFMGSGAGEVGLSSVLGGAVFVTCVVVGTVSLCVDGKNFQIDKKCFVRDVGFFLFTLVLLLFILVVGKVSVLGAAMFVMIYMVYALVVVANEILWKGTMMLKLDTVTPLLPVFTSFSSERNDLDETIYSSSFEGNDPSDVPYLPQWVWASHVAIFSNYGTRLNSPEKGISLWGWNDEGDGANASATTKLLAFLETPLIIVRRLTIPIVEEERWSKAYAVLSATISPVLLAFLLDNGKDSVTLYLVGISLGLFCGTLSILYTEINHPPRRFLLPWVLGGFLMSIVWFYIVANELVSLLVSLGVILSINPSVLGLTVLAWGNSMGDLMTDVALAMSGADGVQIAMSGCYAGPMFNTLVGLGISMLLAASSVAPSLYVLPRDNSLVFTLIFLMLGLVWSLFVLPRNDMRPNRTLGFGLITLYLIFLSIRIGFAIGVI